MNNPTNTTSSFIFDIFCKVKPYTLSYVFRGKISDDLSSKILSFAETGMENTGESTSLKKKVFFIMVESLQNITRHQQIPITNSTFFAIQRLEKDYYITSGNLVENPKIDTLTTFLNKINNLDKESLKEYYKQILANGEISAKGGAGLGFIEMARKSGNKLVYNFKRINEGFSNFYFQTIVSLPGETEGKAKTYATDDSSKNKLDSLQHIDNIITEKDINLIYQVDFTQENLIGILTMTEGNMDDTQELALRKKIFNIIIELLQNIYKHADDPNPAKEGKAGIFLLGEKNGQYFLTTGNLVLKSKINTIKNTIDEINNTSFEKLDEVYNRIMMTEDTKGEKKGAGLGFTDMKLKSGNNIHYAFIPVDDIYCFLEIQIKLKYK